MSKTFDWTAYFEIAGKFVALAEHESAVPLKEAYWRASVSRTYYCAFHKARERWETSRQPFDKHEAHDNLIRAYAGSRERGCTRIAGIFRSLRAQRVVADYRGEKALTAETAKTVHLQAGSLLKLLNELES